MGEGALALVSAWALRPDVALGGWRGELPVE